MTQPHVVELHGTDVAALVRNVTRYLADALRTGDGAIAIARPEHAEAISRGLSSAGIDVEGASVDRRLVVLDAARTLEQIAGGGVPTWDRFCSVIEPLVQDVASRSGGHVRAYGEMVGLLWAAGRRDAAVQLERSWNRLLDAGGVELYCAYPIDITGADYDAADLDEVFCTHTALVPAVTPTPRSAWERAMADLLGPSAPSVPSSIQSARWTAWARLPETEAMILWVRSEFPSRAGQIIERARRYAGAA